MARASGEFLGTERVGRVLAKMAVPATAGMIINALYNVVDALFVGRGVGALALGGLAVAFPLQIIMIGGGLLVGTGAASIISRALGARDPAAAERTFATGYIMAVIGGLLIGVLGQVFLEPIVVAFGATEAIVPHAKEYLRTLLWGAPFMVMAIASNHMVRAEGFARAAMVSMMIGAVANIILDWVFIFPMGMGTAGAALATVIGRGLALVYLLIFQATRSNLRTRFSLRGFQGSIANGILGLGATTFVRQIGGSIMAIAVNNVLRAYGTGLHISAFGIMNRIMIFSFLPLFGVAQGFQPLVGYNYGAGKSDRVAQSLKLALIVATLIATAFFAILQLFTRPIIALFTTDAELIRIGVVALRRTMAAIPLIGLQVIGATYFLAVGKALPSLLLNMSRQILFLIPLILLFPMIWGVRGVWIAFPTADVLASVVTGLLLIATARRRPSDTVS